MTSRFQNKVAVVTGGTTGIGYATAQRLASEGATVVATGTNPETLKAAGASLPSVDFVSSDASNEEAVKELAQYVSEKHGKVDVLFLNAGIAKFAPAQQSDVQLFDDTININLKGPWLAIKHTTPLLQEGASIIATTSIVGQRPFEGASIYSASKAGLRGLLRGVAVELKDQSIRVNSIAPGPIDTPIFDKLDMDNEAKGSFGQMTTLGRLGTSEEIAAAVAFLASDEGAYINGVELNVDGGFVF